MAYTAAEFEWNGNKGTALNRQIYFDFPSYFTVDGVTFHYTGKVTDDEHYITEIHYSADDGRGIVAHQ